MKQNKIRAIIKEELARALKEELDSQGLPQAQVPNAPKMQGASTSYIQDFGTLINNAGSDTPQLEDAIIRANKLPEAFADFVITQIKSGYINDQETQAMLNLTRTYNERCKKDFQWCKRFIERLNVKDVESLKNMINKWKTFRDFQKSSKLEIIRILEEWYYDLNRYKINMAKIKAGNEEMRKSGLNAEYVTDTRGNALDIVDYDEKERKEIADYKKEEPVMVGDTIKITGKRPRPKR